VAAAGRGKPAGGIAPASRQNAIRHRLTAKLSSLPLKMGPTTPPSSWRLRATMIRKLRLSANSVFG